MTESDARITRLLLTQEVTEFLYREAELLDERRYDEWLALLADDLRYWMPMRRNVKYGEEQREFTREGQDIAWFDEGKDTLTRRVKQIQTGIHWAEEPVSRISHLVTNVQIVEATPSVAEAREVTTRCRFLSTATASRPRPTSWSASARMCCGARAKAGASPGARSSSTKMCCSAKT